jgi:hypothetical protein
MSLVWLYVAAVAMICILMAVAAHVVSTVALVSDGRPPCAPTRSPSFLSIAFCVVGFLSLGFMAACWWHRPAKHVGAVEHKSLETKEKVPRANAEKKKAAGAIATPLMRAIQKVNEKFDVQYNS